MPALLYLPVMPFRRRRMALRMSLLQPFVAGERGPAPIMSLFLVQFLDGASFVSA